MSYQAIIPFVGWFFFAIKSIQTRNSPEFRKWIAPTVVCMFMFFYSQLTSEVEPAQEEVTHVEAAREESAPQFKVTEEQPVSSTSVPQEELLSSNEVDERNFSVTAIIGDPLENFTTLYGKPKSNTFHLYQDRILIMDMDGIAYNITLQYEGKSGRGVEKEAAVAEVSKFIPADAVLVKEYHKATMAADGYDSVVTVYESASMVKKLDPILFGEAKPGTFITITKSNENGVFAVTIAPGNNP